MSKDRQSKLLHTIAIREEVGRIGNDAQKEYEAPPPTKPPRREAFFFAPQREGLPRIKQIDVATHYLQQVDTNETAPRKHRSPLMQKEEHRALVVEDIHIKFLAAEHSVTNGHINVRIVPRIKRIEERTSAEQSRDKHRKEE